MGCGPEVCFEAYPGCLTTSHRWLGSLAWSPRNSYHMSLPIKPHVLFELSCLCNQRALEASVSCFFEALDGGRLAVSSAYRSRMLSIFSQTLKKLMFDLFLRSSLFLSITKVLCLVSQSHFHLFASSGTTQLFNRAWDWKHRPCQCGKNNSNIISLKTPSRQNQSCGDSEDIITQSGSFKPDIGFSPEVLMEERNGRSCGHASPRCLNKFQTEGTEMSAGLLCSNVGWRDTGLCQHW